MAQAFRTQNLRLLASILDANDNELIKSPSPVASAVNELTITNAATSVSPSISATGDDTNIGLNLISKGTGLIQINGKAISLANSFTTIGDFSLAFTTTASTSLTLPTSGLLATTSQIPTVNNATLTLAGSGGIGIDSPPTFTANASADKTITITIADAALTIAKLENIATSSILGRTTGSSGPVEILGGSGVVSVIGTNAVSRATNLEGGIAGQIPYQSGANTTLFSAAGSLSQVLLSGAAGAPTWASQSTLSVGSATTAGSVTNALTISSPLTGISYNGSAAVSIGLQDASATLAGGVSIGPQTFAGNKTFKDSVIVSGDLTVNGTTITINSSTLSVDDKNIELGAVIAIASLSSTSNITATSNIVDVTSTSGLIVGQALTKISGTGAFGTNPIIDSIVSATQFTVDPVHAITGSIVFSVSGATDITADTGGITLKGATNKTFNWLNATSSWTSSENLDIVTGKTYKINNVAVLSATTLGSSVVNSSLTSVGTLANLTVTNTITGSVSGSAASLSTSHTFWGQTFNGTQDVSGSLTSVGNITGSSAITITAGGSNQNVVLTPTGTGYTLLNGNVGIGTASPEAILQVANTGRIIGVLRLQITPRTTFYDHTFAIDNDGGGAQGFIYTSGTGGTFPLNTYGELILQAGPRTGFNNGISLVTGTTSPSVKLRIEEGGNVGIGTSSPIASLHIKPTSLGANGFILERYASAAKLIYAYESAADGYLEVRNGSDQIVSKISGYASTATYFQSNVGIGTTVPGTSLEVYAIPATSTTLRQMLIINTDFASATGTGFGGSIVFRGRTPGNLLRDNAQISAYNEDIGDNGYALGFYTRPSDGGGLQQRLTILRAGNVGIGTTSVSANLVVGYNGTVHYEEAGATNVLIKGKTGNARALLEIHDSAGLVKSYFQSVYSTGLAYIGTYSAHGLVLTTGGTEKVRLDTNGNVGIGIIAPVAKLHINSTTAGETVLRSDGTNGTLFSVVDDLSDSLMSVNNSAGLPVLEVFADDRIVAGQYGQNDFVVINNKVGLGANSPINKLSVIGSASIGDSTYNVSAPTNGLIIQGDVGIGTATPTAQANYRFLQVNGPVSAIIETTVAGVRIGGFDSTSNTLFVGTIGAFPIVFRTGVNEKWRITNAGVLQSSTAQTIQTATGILTLATLAGDGHIVLSPHGNGNVGIGTATPGAKLDVNGEAKLNNLLWFTPSSGSTAIGVSGTNFQIYNGAGAETRLTIDNSGNVGIGTTSPSTNLHIGATAASGGASGALGVFLSRGVATNFFEAFDGTKSFIAGVDNAQSFAKVGTFSNHPVSITQGNGSAIYIDTSKNVGIGTTIPAYKLDVGGTARVGDTFLITTATTADARLEIGSGRSGNGNSYLDLVGDATYTDYGLRLIRYDSGANSNSRLEHKGTGQLQLFVSETGSLTISTNSFERVRVDSSGNVGIGTTSPSYRLQLGSLAGSPTSTPETINLGGTYSNTAGSNIKLRVYDDGSSSGGMSVSSGQMEVNTWATGKIAFYRGTTQSAIIDDNGNVGIGTTSPTGSLQVNKASQTLGATTPSGATIISNLAGGNGILELGVDTTNLAYIQSRNITDQTYYKLLLNPSGGSVGIGITSPAATLDVNGATFLRGNLDAGRTASLNSTVAVNGTGGGNREFVTFTGASTTGFTGTDNADQGYGYFAATIVLGKSYEVSATMVVTNGATLDWITSTALSSPAIPVQMIQLTPVSNTIYRFTATGDAAYVGLGFSRASGTMTAVVSNFSIKEVSILVTSNSNVGIVTTSPTNTLDVNGSARVRSISASGSAATVFLTTDANGVLISRTAAQTRSDIGAGIGNGSVTSVSGTGTVSGISLGGTVTTTGDLTLSGTLTVTPSNFASQTANTFLAAPSGAAGAPTFRAMVSADIPADGIVTTKILNSNVTLAKIQNIAVSTVLGNSSSSAAQAPLEISMTTLAAMLSGKTMDIVGNATNVTGVVAIANGGTGIGTTAANAFFVGPDGSTGAPSFRAMVSADIPTGIVSYSKIQNVNPNTVLGRITNSVGIVEELSGANIATIIGSSAITNASNVTIATDDSTASSYYLYFGANITGNTPLKASTKIRYNPSTGAFSATTKSFRIPHPTKLEHDLVYGSLESPYYGVRLTGKGKTKGNRAEIFLPDYIKSLIDEETVNIQLTAIKCAKILYIENIIIDDNKFTVKYDKPWYEKCKDIEFYWDFTAERKDVPKLIVEEKI